MFIDRVSGPTPPLQRSGMYNYLSRNIALLRSAVFRFAAAINILLLRSRAAD